MLKKWYEEVHKFLP